MARFEFSLKNFDNIPCNYELTMDGFEDMPAGRSCSMESEAFPWIQYPDVVTGVRFLLKEARAGVYVSLPIDKHSTTVDDIKPFPAIYYVVKDARGGNRDYVVSYNRPFGWNLMDFLHCEECKLIKKSYLTDPAYNANGSVLIRIYVEPPAMDRRVYSYEGFLSWNLENFSRQKLKGLEGLCGEESPYFYTGPAGYRVRVFVRPKGKVLQVLLYFCAGQFDQDLSTSFPHYTTVTLLNRKSPEGNVEERVRRDIRNGAAYCIEMIIDEDVEDLIEDNTLFYTVSIRPLRYKI